MVWDGTAILQNMSDADLAERIRDAHRRSKALNAQYIAKGEKIISRIRTMMAAEESNAGLQKTGAALITTVRVGLEEVQACE